jgi:hypothetical protein
MFCDEKLILIVKKINLKNKFFFFGDTLEIFRDTQMCRDTRFENH